MEEIWKDVSGYCGYYQVSNTGKVRSVERTVLNSGKKCKIKGKLLKQTPQTKGYLTVNLCVENKRSRQLVHRLVAKEFIPNPENKPHINHKDETKTNNIVDNLEWCDEKYNNNYGTFRERISKSMSKAIICVELNKLFYSQKEASKSMNIDQASISFCCYHPNRTAGGYHWKFAEG